jgi:succinylglutamate desuccinylase
VTLLPDFEQAAARFRVRGWRATCHGPALWQFQRGHGKVPPLQLLITAGVHGNETAPISILHRRLMDWADAASDVSADLLVAIGNLDAVVCAKRFIHYDMNRMFGRPLDTTRWGLEGERAALLARTIEATCRSNIPCVHLDLHSTLRPSLQPSFAIVPSRRPSDALLYWLSRAGLHAVVLNPGPASTLSTFSATQGAISCTIELGQVGDTSEHQQQILAQFDRALDALVRNPAKAWLPRPVATLDIPTFEVTQTLLRSSEAFKLLLPHDTPNFYPLTLGQVVARDAHHSVVISTPNTCVLFPNPGVALGLRAGLLLAPINVS